MSAEERSIETAKSILMCVQYAAQASLALFCLYVIARVSQGIINQFPDEPWRESLRPDNDDEK